MLAEWAPPEEEEEEEVGEEKSSSQPFPDKMPYITSSANVVGVCLPIARCISKYTER